MLVLVEKQIFSASPAEVEKVENLEGETTELATRNSKKRVETYL
jgi:hypothetical protein